MSWLSSGLKKIGGVVARAVPGGQALEAVVKTAGGDGSFGDNLKGVLGRDASIASSALGGGGAGGGVLSKLGGASGLIDLGLGALSGYQGYQAQKKGDKLNQQALDAAMARDRELLPLRQAGIQQLLAAKRPDLSADFASSNPFARPLQRIG